METNKDNITELNLGIQTDTALNNQPKGSQRFALNTINETASGDLFLKSNEESNEAYVNFPENFIPIGKIYLSKNEVGILLVKNDNSVSEIGILKDNCTYETHVNDEFSSTEDKLNFRLDKQIQGTYRLRLGCERTIYFTDDYNRPRYYNYDKAEDFKNDNGTFSGAKFNLSKEYQNIPEFKSVKVLDSGGSIEPGSVNISIRYLDESLNASEWITTSPIINIYNKALSEDFLDIQGSINSSTDYIDFPTTDKSIEVIFDKLDTSNYIYYQLAFIEANSGNGLVTSVKYTDVIPTSKNYFIYTGQNHKTEGTTEEILMFNNIINRAGSIEQIENRLILGNTQGKQVNFCKLQKYASKIKADVVLKEVYANQIQDSSNTKNPTVHFGDMNTGGVGYMPGEIYSYGINYVFKDGSISPTYHIPGKNPSAGEDTIFTQGENIFPMSVDNSSTTSKYFNEQNCDGDNYWGLDSEGEELEQKAVRHHRFPLRGDLKIPLIKEEIFEDSLEQTFTYYYLEIEGNGDITLPVSCTEDEVDCVEVVAPSFQVRVTYTIDGVEDTLITNINPLDISSVPAQILNNTVYFTSNNIIVTKIEESTDDGSTVEVSSGEVSPKGLTYSTSIKTASQTSEGKVYKTQIFGIKFSGIDLPSLEDTAGEEIIGYYIVRSERTDVEKTILDSAVLVPTLENSKYIAHGLLGTELTDTTKYNKNVYGVISPEYKFKDKQYSTFDYIKQEGVFNIINRKYSKTSYNDVLEGSSYDSGVHKKNNDDGNTLDGFSLTTILRDNILKFSAKEGFNILKSQIKQIFYLSALESRDINDGVNTVYNIASDNKINMIQLEEDTLTPQAGEYPYVILGKNNADPYSNFRTFPYYKESINVEKFTDNKSTATIFNGDSYVVPMRYTNTVFWDNRLADRATKTSAWNYIIGGIIVVVGAILAFFTAGASTVVIGLGISLMGAGALFISSGVTRDAMTRAYNGEYAKGLRETALDDWVEAFYKYKDNLYTRMFGFTGNGETGQTGPSDDEIQWIGDTFTDLWFETTINISLRNKMVSDVPTFLDAPGVIETGNNSIIYTNEFFKKYYTSSNPSRYPLSKLDYHVNKKLLVYNSDNKDSKEYVGLALGEYYQVNPDYMRFNKEKIFYHLPLEYSCCSDCQEDFPHRWHYSEQSFQEELTDNYRMFLSNNYKDLEGETGEITNIFKIGNDLFIHTEEALWQIPRSNQERVTDQIISFIGTGSYGEVPAKKIMDDDTGSSAGSRHKWGLIKTPNGVFFPSEAQRKIYQFNGQQLKPISSQGNESWFKNNMELLANKEYYEVNGDSYPQNNNPSNPNGVGYISTYDTSKERIIFTKKDFVFNLPEDTNTFQICSNADSNILFKNFKETVEAKELEGWRYVGIIDCKLAFEKDKIVTTTEERSSSKTVVVSSSADIVIHMDMSGSFNATTRTQIKTAVNSWLTSFKQENPDWQGNLYYSEQGGYESQRCWKVLRFIKDKLNILDITGTPTTNILSKDIIAVSFVNENLIGDFGVNLCYHDLLTNPMKDGTTDFYNDYNDFITLHDELIAGGGSFSALNYPIVYSTSTTSPSTKGFLLHTLAVVKGVPYTETEVDSLDINPYMDSAEWETLRLSLQGTNPYPDNGLGNYGWIVKSNRGWAGGSDEVITSAQFKLDMNSFLESTTSTEVIITEKEIKSLVSEYSYVEGEVVENLIKANNSWTMSYSLKQEAWVSWHSYLPNFYINVPEKFYSWIDKSTAVWKHNVKGKYQSFYGKVEPFILEYVSLSTPLQTRIWEYLSIIAEVKKYDPDYDDYVDINNKFFNKMIAYNSRQASGVLNIKVKNAQEEDDYEFDQNNEDLQNEVLVSNVEKNWNINELRDIRVDYNIPLFKSKILDRQAQTYIDKILNEASLDYDKDWTELESFRDKFLVIRLIFDSFAEDENGQDGSVKILMNFSSENETQSIR